MKKLLLASFIMFGCISFAAAQANDIDPNAAKTSTPAAKEKHTPTPKEQEVDAQKFGGPRVKTMTPASKSKKTVANKPTVVATEPKKANQ